jgi:2-polyprenyl-3-methyl-5-hydroxy-6-metoxy-1,4-benzoquinol methylase
MTNEPLSNARALAPATRAVVDAVLLAWPEHIKFLRKSFSDRSDELLATTETICRLLGEVAADRGRSLAEFATSYRYLCEEIVMPEELYFQRHGRYRLSTYAEAAAEVYDNHAVMARYMDGLLVSDALWLNHASAMNDFVNSYLANLDGGGAHLEIGPGHGLLLHLAIRSGKFRTLAAWDVSETSIEHTRQILSRLGEANRVDLRRQDIYATDALNNAGQFSSIVFSEILEHLERPGEALAVIKDLLAPGGTVWINVPANGPAPDHLFLVRSLEEASEFIAAAGLEVVRTAAYPVAGASLERAERQGLPMSCIVVGGKAA